MPVIFCAGEPKGAECDDPRTRNQYSYGVNPICVGEWVNPHSVQQTIPRGQTSRVDPRLRSLKVCESVNG